MVPSFLLASSVGFIVMGELGGRLLSIEYLASVVIHISLDSKNET